MIDLNNAFENLFGYLRVELTGRPITDFDI